MKKLILLVILLTITVSLTSCGTKDFDNKSKLKKSPCACLEVRHV